MPTPKKPPLTAVPEPVTSIEPAPRLTIEQAATSLDYRALREATLIHLARRVQDDETAPRDLAALSRRMLDVADELEEQDEAARVAALEAEAARAAALLEKGTGTSGLRGTAGKPFSIASL